MKPSTQDPIVITSIARTPIGGFLGSLKDFSSVQLGAEVIKTACARANLQAHDIQSVLMGCVLSAGQGQAPARQATLAAGLPVETHATTINKVCGSGMQSVIFAHQALQLGDYQVMIAGGMESMSNAPYLLLKARQGYRAGHGELKDHLFLDGLEDAYRPGALMGIFAENTAKKYQFSREAQDDFALASLARAQKAIARDYYQQEIIAIQDIQLDELPQKAKPEKIPLLKPAFAKDGTVTAANSSSISDGAAAVTLMRLSEANKRRLNPLAKIHAYASYSQAPEWFTTAPAGAIRQLYEKTGWSDQQVDIYEINEAFAVVTMAVMHDLHLSHEKVNIHGGACVLGHPIGASGTRMIISLISALKTHGLKRGIASVCIGGGEALALAIELI